MPSPATNGDARIQELQRHARVLESLVAAPDDGQEVAAKLRNLEQRTDLVIALLSDIVNWRFNRWRRATPHKRRKERAVCNGNVCGDAPGPCGAKEGELHRFGCNNERCTKCSQQFLYCDCPEDFSKRTRVPYFELAWQRCERCGEPWPDFFDVPDDVWQRYVISLGDGDKMLCICCFNLIAELTDGSAYAREHGGAVMLKDINPDAPASSAGRARWEEWESRRNAPASLDACSDP
jgi:hypothetical protein